MNKKLNTVLFLLGATALNLLLLCLVAIVLLAVFGLAYRGIEEVSAGLAWLAVIVILFGSIFGTFFIYSRLIKWASAKWNLERFIMPVFGSNRR